MLKTILVPLDGSARAERPLPLAVRLASHAGATIILVRVASLAAEFWPAIMTPYPRTMQTVVDAEMEEASAYLTQCASSRLFEELDVRPSCGSVRWFRTFSQLRRPLALT